MILTEAIKLVNPEKMMITWDTGRRCNFDCSYCEATRHNNYSKHHSYEELMSTFSFIKEYTKIYNSEKNNINFTGGEPTVNPNFWKFVYYLKENEPNFSLGLTTNGAWPVKRSDEIIDLFSGVTISYHAESAEKIKNQIIENIKILSKSNIFLQVNVMIHVDYFEETKNLCYLLKDLGIRHNPRPIGDGNIQRSGWFTDSDGTLRRTSHTYTEEQQEWFFSYIGQPNPAKTLKEGTQLGRSCCGGRCLSGKVNGVWQDIKHVDTNFKDWFCSVNKYFLHIDQHTGNVYHHQTCKAKFEFGERGPIGNLNNTTSILEYAKSNLEKTIVCPNQRCGCGMCVPKAKTLEEYKSL